VADTSKETLPTLPPELPVYNNYTIASIPAPLFALPAATLPRTWHQPTPRTDDIFKTFVSIITITLLLPHWSHPVELQMHQDRT